MGLDITAYSNLKHVGQHAEEMFDGTWCENEDHVQAYAFDCFEQSFRGVPILRREPPRGDGAGTLYGGCYEKTAATETHSFRAGSYVGYSRWREHLQREFNPDREPDQPFYELIWFADNEGAIGPEAATDLLADFWGHRDLYRDACKARVETYYAEVYDDWAKAFELAAGSGLVAFH